MSDVRLLLRSNHQKNFPSGVSSRSREAKSVRANARPNSTGSSAIYENWLAERWGVRPLAKVMDLGVARLNDEALRLSQTGAFVGSIHYAAPECFSEGGKNVDGRADLHALGVTLYELATGVHPL